MKELIQNPAAIQSETIHPNQEAIDRLRKLADFIEVHPGIGRIHPDAASLSIFHADKESLVAAMRSLGGKWDKEPDDTFFTTRQKVDGISVYLNVYRHRVCEMRKVMKTIPARAAINLPEQPEHEEETTEWVCPESILQEVDQANL